MTPDDFRRLALALPDAIEVGHMDHPDFRVGGKVFATLGYPTDEWAMVKLGPDEQLALCAAKPKIFVPVKGAWGAAGATNVRLDVANVKMVREALGLAYTRSLAKQKRPR